MNEINYNFHNIFKIKIRNPSLGLKDLNRKYSFFEVKKISNPDIIINIGKFKPSNKNCYIVDKKYFVKDNYFYCEDSYKFAKWQVEIKGIEKGKMIVNFNSKILKFPDILFPDLLLHNYVIKPLMEHRLAEKKYFLIHGSCVSKEGRGYLFTGRTSVGKTTIAMKFVRKGFDFLGDDILILHKDKILCFPTHIDSFDFMVRNLPTEKLTNFDRIKMLFHLIKKQKRVVNVENSCLLDSVFLILRTNKRKVNVKKKIKKNYIIKMFILNNKIERKEYQSFKYFMAYSYIYPKYLQKLQQHISKSFKNIKCKIIEVPQACDAIMYNIGDQ